MNLKILRMKFFSHYCIVMIYNVNVMQMWNNSRCYFKPCKLDINRYENNKRMQVCKTDAFYLYLYIQSVLGSLNLVNLHLSHPSGYVIT
jgi:hypothetical protein